MHIADTHIGSDCSFLGAKADERSTEILMSFEKAADICNDEKIELMLLCGDLFDSNSIEENILNTVFDKIAALENTKVVFAAGNHDPLTADSPFLNRKLPDNLFVLKGADDCIVFEELKTKVYGSSFTGVYKEGKNRFSVLPEDDGYIHLMALHADASQSLSGNYNPITAEFITKSGMDYIALGHKHRATEVQYAGKVPVAYCGCTEGRGFDELGEKGVYIGEVGKGICNLEFRKLSKRVHHSFSADVTGCEDIPALILSKIKEISASPSDDLFRIVLKGSYPSASLKIGEIKSRISEKTYFCKIKDETSPVYDAEILKSENSLKGAFFRLMSDKIDAANEEEKTVFIKALEIGLKSFDGEVPLDED